MGLEKYSTKTKIGFEKYMVGIRNSLIYSSIDTLLNQISLNKWVVVYNYNSPVLLMRSSPSNL